MSAAVASEDAVAMTARLEAGAPTGRRARIAWLERPLLAAGLALVALHLLDLRFSGSHRSPPRALLILAVSP